MVVRNGNAEGIEFWSTDTGDDVVLRADALNEAVLAAGSIGSPHLLQVSGVGDPEELEEHGACDRFS